MALPVPYGLSPSKVESFKSCALAFRFSAIDRLPEPPVALRRRRARSSTARSSCCSKSRRARRTLEAAMTALDRAFTEMSTDPDLTGLGLDDEQLQSLPRRRRGARPPVLPPRRPDGGASRSASSCSSSAEVGGSTLRGIIDRLELDDDGELVVTDYKTGRPPHGQHEQGRLSAASTSTRFLCERVLGRRPARVQLLYLSEPIAIIAHAVRAEDGVPRPQGRTRSGRRSSGRASPRLPAEARGAVRLLRVQGRTARRSGATRRRSAPTPRRRAQLPEPVLLVGGVADAPFGPTVARFDEAVDDAGSTGCGATRSLTASSTSPPRSATTACSGTSSGSAAAARAGRTAARRRRARGDLGVESAARQPRPEVAVQPHPARTTASALTGCASPSRAASRAGTPSSAFLAAALLSDRRPLPEPRSGTGWRAWSRAAGCT